MGSDNEAQGTIAILLGSALCVCIFGTDCKKRFLILTDEACKSNRACVQDGLRFTYFWIKEQIEKEKKQGFDIAAYGSSKVVSTQAPVQLGSLRAADGKEGL